MIVPQAHAGQAGHAVIAAVPADTGVLSRLIAEAFFPLAPCRWLVPDGAARRQVLPGYFRLHLEHAIADGLVRTTPGRTPAALWIPAGTEPETPPEGYSERLAEITGRHVSRFLILDAEFASHHPAGIPHHYLAILGLTQQQAAAALGWSLSKLARIEAGRSGISVAGMQALLALYQVSDDQAGPVLELARAARTRPWHARYPVAMTVPGLA
jgi:hypothetical protein